MSNESGTHQRYEDLPVAYSRLWEFENIGATMKEGRRVFGDAAQLSGEYCRIVIGDIDPEVAARYNSAPLVISTLFAHETQVTVCHATLKRTTNDLDPEQESLKSKSELSLWVGFRRMPVRAIFADVR